MQDWCTNIVNNLNILQPGNRWKSRWLLALPEEEEVADDDYEEEAAADNECEEEDVEDEQKAYEEDYEDVHEEWDPQTFLRLIRKVKRSHTTTIITLFWCGSRML